MVILDQGQSGISQQKTQTTSIYDCLQTFSQEELITNSNKWFCSHCKSHVPAIKKIQIYRLPEYLIIHFKRFSHQRNQQSRKVQKLIDFPLEKLDMTPYLTSGINQNSKIHYDLYGISNHYGTLSGGHYTANCLNPLTHLWYEFDDSKVTKIKNPE